MGTSFQCEKADAVKKRLLPDQWPLGRRQAKARDVLSMAGEWRTLTHVVRAGRYVSCGGCDG